MKVQFVMVLFYISSSLSINVRDFPLHENVLTDYMSYDGAYMDQPQEYDGLPKSYYARTARQIPAVEIYPVTNKGDYVSDIGVAEHIANFVHKYNIQTSRSYLSEENDQKFGQIIKQVKGAQKIFQNVEVTFDRNKPLVYANDKVTEFKTEKNESVHAITPPVLTHYNHIKQDVFTRNVDPIQQNYEPIKNIDHFESVLEDFRPFKGKIHKHGNDVSGKYIDIVHRMDKTKMEETVTEETIQELITTMATIPQESENIPTNQRIFYYFKDPVLNSIGRKFLYNSHRHLSKNKENKKQRSKNKNKSREPKRQWGDRCSHDPEGICIFSRQCGFKNRAFKGDSKCKGSEPMICCELHGLQWKLFIDESSDSSDEKHGDHLMDIKLGSKTKQRLKVKKVLRNHEPEMIKKNASFMHTTTKEYTSNKPNKTSNITDSLVNEILLEIIQERAEKTRKSLGRVLRYFDRDNKTRRKKNRRRRVLLRHTNNFNFANLLHDGWKIKAINLNAKGIIKLINYLIKDALGVIPNYKMNKKNVKSFIEDNPELQDYLKKWSLYGHDDDKEMEEFSFE